MTDKITSTSLREIIFERDNYTCQYCGFISSDSSELAIDHIRAWKDGGTNDIHNLITACFRCNVLKADKHLIDVISESSDHIIKFRAGTESIRSLMNIEISPGKLKNEHNCMLVAYLITVMETYLSDKIISEVLTSESLLKKFVKNNPDFSKQKFTLSEVFEQHDLIRETVEIYLLNQIFHRLDKVKKMYVSVFDIEFPKDLERIFHLINLRHDIVHRNGKTKFEKKIQINSKELLSAIEDVESFIYSIEDLLSK